MATNYPTNFDTSTTLPAEAAGVPLSTNHVIAHQNLQDSMEAVQAKVGIDGSAVTTTHDYKLSEVTSTDKAVSKTATQTLTNKTLTSPVISNPTLNLTSGATGDMYYNGGSGVVTRLAAVEGKIVKVVGGVPTMATETVTVNASTTVAGIVEEATQAEVDAGTATGGTGARLFINPSTISVSSAKTNFLAGEAITAGNAVSGYYYQSDGGITYDAKTTNNSSVTSAGGTVTFSHTVANQSNRMLVLIVNVGASSGTVPTPTVTYNSVSMSAVRTETPFSSSKLFSFTLAAPDTGTNNVALTLGASAQTNYVSSCVYSYYGVSAVENSAGDTTSTVAYGTPALGVVLVSGAIGGGSASANNFTNSQGTGPNTQAQAVSADSGVAFTTSSATVTYTSGSAITVVGLTPTTTPVYGYVVKSSAATPANAVNLNKYTTFSGIAQASVSAGASVSVVTDGNATNLSGLTPLATYFLSDTAGAISATAGTNSKKVGYANSATSLILKDTI